MGPVSKDSFSGQGLISDPPRRGILFAAHPDDETIGLGGQLPRLAASLAIVHLTNGAPETDNAAQQQAYADDRRRELLCAMRLAGIAEDRCLLLGAVDQQSSFGLDQWTFRFLELLQKFKPEVVYCHPYEGGHPDHDAAAFIACFAVRLLRLETGIAPRLLEFASYHAGPEGMETGCFLPNGEAPTEFPLNAAQRELKQRMFECMPSQRAVLEQFRIDSEYLRAAPNYDFTLPPHPGALYYERFDWGIDGARWREAAAEAWDSIGATQHT